MSSAQQQLSKLRLWRGLWYSSIKIGKCSSKNSPRGFNYIFFFSGEWPLFRLELLVLSRLSRLWKDFWTDRADSGKNSDQTVQTVSGALIWPCWLWMGPDQTIQTVDSDARLCGVVALYPPPPMRDPSWSDQGSLGLRTSSWDSMLEIVLTWADVAHDLCVRKIASCTGPISLNNNANCYRRCWRTILITFCPKKLKKN